MTLAVFDAGVKLNQAKDGDTNPANDHLTPKLGWTDLFDDNLGLEPENVPDVDGVDIEVQGSLLLDAFGVVLVKGSFKLQLGTVIGLGSDDAVGGTANTPAADTTYQAMVLTLGEDAFVGAQPVQVFIGVGGELEDNPAGVALGEDPTPLDFADDELNLDSGIGFYAELDNLSLITLKNNNKTPTNPADDKSYLGLQLRGLTATLIGIDGLTLAVFDAGVKLNQAKDGDTNPANDHLTPKLGWTDLFDDNLGLEPANVPDVDGVDIEVQGSLLLDAFGVVLVKGSFMLQLGTVIGLGSDDAVGGTANTPAADTTYQAMVLTLGEDAFVGAQPVQVFIGVGGELEDNPAGVALGEDPTPLDFADDELNLDSGIGFYAELDNLSLITLKNNNKTPTNPADDKSYLVMKITGFGASLIGVEPLTLSVWNVSVEVNQAKDTDTNPANDPPKLNWADLFDDNLGLEPASVPNVAPTVDVAASGSIVIDIDGFVQVFGSFAFSKKSAVPVTTVRTDGQTVDRTVDVITIGLEEVNVFVGAGPYFEDSATDANTVIDEDDPVNTDAVGLLLEDVSLALALFKPTTGLGSYYALMASAETVDLLGLDVGGSSAFSLTASGYRIEISGGSSGTPGVGAAIDFSKMQGGKYIVETGPGLEFAFDYTSTLQRVAIENAVLKIDSYLYVSGGLAFTRQLGLTVKLSDAAETERVVDAFAFGAGSVDLFAGESPSDYFADTDGNDVIDELDDRPVGATGLVLENVDFGLLIMRPSGIHAAFKATKYLALKATADFAGLVGIEDFKLSASGITVEYNTVKTTDTTDTRVVDFKKSFPDTDGPLTGDAAGYELDLGNGELLLNYDTKRLLVSIEVADLQISSYVFVHGAMAFEKTDDVWVSVIGDPTQTRMSVTTVGGQDLTMFFGANGPYWTDLDGNNDITWAFNSGFGDVASRTITAGSVTIGTTTYGVGDVLPMDVVGTLDADDAVLVFGNAAAGTEVRYGNIANYDTVDPGETGELNENAIGLAIVDADLALALLAPQDGTTTRYTALKASSEFVGFVGTDIFQLEASNVVVELNIATRPSATVPLPVVNFAASFPGGFAGIFAVFDTNKDKSISVEELNNALNYNHGRTEAITTVEQLADLLDIGGAPPAADDGIVSVSDVVALLENTFKVATSTPLGPTNLERIQAADSNHNGKYDSTDPTGYEVKTGGVSTYLDQAKRQIHASADNVLVQVSEFVYVSGNFAIDMGSRETVTIKTGIPANIGDVGATVITTLNTGLATLKTQVAAFKTTVQTEIQNAIATIKLQILGEIDSIVDLIFAQLNNALATAITNVTGALAGQVQTLTANLSATIGTQIDGMLANVTTGIPAPFDSLVKLLLKPVKEQITTAIQDSLKEALTGNIDRIAASVKTAIGQALAGTQLQIKAEIHAILEPQINRITAKLTQLSESVFDRITPVFTRLESLLKIQVGEGFATLQNVEVDVTAIGISDAIAFIGAGPYWTDLNGDHEVSWAFNTGNGNVASRTVSAGSVTIGSQTYGPNSILPANQVATVTAGVATVGGVNYGDINSDSDVDPNETRELNGNAIGLFVENLNMGLGIFEPVVGKQLPTFTAMKLTADSAGFVDGGSDIFEMVAEGITVELNLGGAVVPGPWTGTIDFLTSFPGPARLSSRRVTAWIREPRAPRSTWISRAGGSSPASSGRRSRSPSSCTSRAASRSRRAAPRQSRSRADCSPGSSAPP